MNYKEYFKGKKITLMGLGILGRGVNIAKFLAECGVNILITDLKSKEELSSSTKELKKFKNIRYVLGGHRLSDFKNGDFIIKAAGVPLDSPYIKEAKQNNIPVEMDASLFSKLVPNGVIIIGVTGTRGKSTVTQLIYKILKGANKPVYLGGNVKGIATLPLLKKVKTGDYIVLELDSWQLQGFSDSRISPHVAVFTNFMRDHMNYYKNSMTRYFKDKSNIYKYQTRDDFIICGPSVSGKIKTKSRKIIFHADDIPKSWSTKLIGEHNRQNIATAVAVSEALCIPKNIVKKAVEDFSGIAGRLEHVKSIRGVRFYNDTNSTTPDATLAAVTALNASTIIYDSKKKVLISGSRDKNIILISGGTDKNLDYRKFAKIIPKHVKKLVLLQGTATEKIKRLLSRDFEYDEVRSLKDAIDRTEEILVKGDTVLFSPGAASFGLFKNEYDRGEQFIELIKKL